MRCCVGSAHYIYGDMHQADQPAVRGSPRGCHFRHMCPLDGLPGPHGPVLSCTAPMPLQPHMVPSSGSYATCKSLTCPLLQTTSLILPNLRLAPPCATTREALHPAQPIPAQHLVACMPIQSRSLHKRSKHTQRPAVRPPKAIGTRCSVPVYALQSTGAQRGGKCANAHNACCAPCQVVQCDT